MKNNKLNPKTARLLDANLNRAREGLRVVEDAARFLWDEKKIYTKIRRIRHKLQSLSQTRAGELVKSRNSTSDVGRTLKEGRRPSSHHIIVANMKRAQEATRVLEEFSKVFSPSAARDFKKVRYQLYTLEKDVLKRSLN